MRRGHPRPSALQCAKDRSNRAWDTPHGSAFIRGKSGEHHKGPRFARGKWRRTAMTSGRPRTSLKTVARLEPAASRTARHVAIRSSRGLLGDAIGRALGALCRKRYPAEEVVSSECTRSPAFPVEFDVRQRSRHHHDVVRTITENPVGDVNVATLGVSGLGFHGFPDLSPTLARPASKQLSQTKGFSEHGPGRRLRGGAAVFRNLLATSPTRNIEPHKR